MEFQQNYSRQRKRIIGDSNFTSAKIPKLNTNSSLIITNLTDLTNNPLNTECKPSFFQSYYGSQILIMKEQCEKSKIKSLLMDKFRHEISNYYKQSKNSEGPKFNCCN